MTAWIPRRIASAASVPDRYGTTATRMCAAIVLCAALAGCASSPVPRHYTLGPAEGGAVAAARSDLSMVIGPISLPALIDRRPIVRTLDGHRVDIADGHRWAGTLKSEIAQRLTSAVARESGLTRVAAWPQSSIVRPDLSLRVDVQRFETEDFGKVTLEAVWTARRDSQDVASQRFVAAEAMTAPTYEALVAAHGRLIDALAKEVAAALP